MEVHRKMRQTQYERYFLLIRNTNLLDNTTRNSSPNGGSDSSVQRAEGRRSATLRAVPSRCQADGLPLYSVRLRHHWLTEMLDGVASTLNCHSSCRTGNQEAACPQLYCAGLAPRPYTENDIKRIDSAEFKKEYTKSPRVSVERPLNIREKKPQKPDKPDIKPDIKPDATPDNYRKEKRISDYEKVFGVPPPKMPESSKYPEQDKTKVLDKKTDNIDSTDNATSSAAEAGTSRGAADPEPRVPDSTGSCQKCVDKGRTCVSKCPQHDSFVNVGTSTHSFDVADKEENSAMRTQITTAYVLDDHLRKLLTPPSVRSYNDLIVCPRCKYKPFCDDIGMNISPNSVSAVFSTDNADKTSQDCKAEDCLFLCREI